jgi:hypothetical protein
MGRADPLVASGVSAETLAPEIKQREREIAKLEVQLRAPKRERPDIERLRDALNQRAAEWRETLRSEPEVSRVLLRRLVGPLTLFDPADTKAFVEWETSLSPALIEGLAEIHGIASPRRRTGVVSAPQFRVPRGRNREGGL